MRPLSAILLLILGTIGTAFGGTVEQADDSLLDRRAKSLLRAMESSPLPFPPDVAKEGDANVIVTIGGAFVDILAVSQPESEARKLAEALAKSPAPIDGATFRYSGENGYAVVRAKETFEQFGKRSSSITVPIGVIAKQVREAGFNVHIAYRTPKHATATATKLPSSSTENYRYVDATKADATTMVRVEAKVSPYSFLLLFLLVGFPAVMTLIGLLAGWAVGKNEKIPIRRRRRLYTKVVMGFSFGSILVHMPMFLALMFTGVIRPITDLWMGGSSSTLTPFLMVGLVPMFLVLPFLTKIEKRLFGPEPEEEQTLLPPPPEPTEEEKRLRKRIATLTMPFSFAPLAAFLLSRSKSIPSAVMIPIFIATIVLMVAGPAIIRRLNRDRLAAFDGPTEDPELQAEIDELAIEMGTRVKSVRIVTDPLYRQFAYASASLGGRVSVNRRFLEVMTKPERRAILAHEVAHIRLGHLPRRMAYILLPAVLMMLPMAMLPTLGTAFPSKAALYTLLAFPMFGFVWIFIVSKWVSRKHERQADLLALETTRDYLSMESALRKMVMSSPMPHLNDVEDLATHPTFSRRLQYLRERATELGLVVTPSTEKRVPMLV